MRTFSRRIRQVRVGIAFILRRAENYVNQSDIVTGWQTRPQVYLAVEFCIGIGEQVRVVRRQTIGEGCCASDACLTACGSGCGSRTASCA